VRWVTASRAVAKCGAAISLGMGYAIGEVCSRWEATPAALPGGHPIYRGAEMSNTTWIFIGLSLFAVVALAAARQRKPHGLGTVSNQWMVENLGRRTLDTNSNWI
jgi:hypothetical protein